MECGCHGSGRIYTDFLKPKSFLIGVILHGQIFAPAISAFTTSMWIMQEEEQSRIRFPTLSLAC